LPGEDNEKFELFIGSIQQQITRKTVVEQGGSL
jgi:hypothetical protein